MNTTVRGFLLGVLVTLAVLALVIVAVAFTGAVNVAATHDHLPGVEWFLETLQHASVEGHAEAAAIAVPADLDSPQRVDEGLRAFHAMCVQCHGAPGVEASWIGKGVAPVPPELSQESMTPEELYWVVEHGIRMTAMPALAPTHSDEEIWSLVAFLEQLEGMTAEEYARRVEEAGLELQPGDGGHGHGDHDHGGGTAAGAEGSGASGEAAEGGEPSPQTSSGDDGHEHEHDDGHGSV